MPALWGQMRPAHDAVNLTCVVYQWLAGCVGALMTRLEFALAGVLVVAAMVVALRLL